MFPRRRTDQVYSTLQQVQRRITEQGGGTVPPGGQVKAMPPVAIPSRQPGVQVPPVPMPGAAQETAAPATTPTISEQLSAMAPAHAAPPATAHQPMAPMPAAPTAAFPQAPALYPPASGARRYVIQLSSEMATLICIIGLGMMVVCYLLGRYQAGSGAGAGLASGPAGNREAIEAPVRAERERLFVLVLQRAPGTAASERNFQEAAKRWNEFARKNPQQGIRPCFAVRRTRAGQSEFYYGNVDGKIGVPQDLAFAEFMSKSQLQGGGGFGAANWVAVDE